MQLIKLFWGEHDLAHIYDREYSHLTTNTTTPLPSPQANDKVGILKNI